MFLGHPHICGFTEWLYFFPPMDTYFLPLFPQQTKERTARKTINTRKEKKEVNKSSKEEQREFEIWRLAGKQKMNHVWKVKLKGTSYV